MGCSSSTAWNAAPCSASRVACGVRTCRPTLRCIALARSDQTCSKSWRLRASAQRSRQQSPAAWAPRPAHWAPHVDHVHQQLGAEPHTVVAHRHRHRAADGAEDLPGRLGSQQHAQQQQGRPQLATGTQPPQPEARNARDPLAAALQGSCDPLEGGRETPARRV